MALLRAGRQATHAHLAGRGVVEATEISEDACEIVGEERRGAAEHARAGQEHSAWFRACSPRPTLSHAAAPVRSRWSPQVVRGPARHTPLLCWPRCASAGTVSRWAHQRGVFDRGSLCGGRPGPAEAGVPAAIS